MENEILNQILSELIGLKSEFKELKSEFKELKQGQADLTAEVQEIKERIILIENEHGQNIKALHDGHVMLLDICQEIRNDIRNLYTRQDRQDTRIMLLGDEVRKNNDAV